MLTWYMMDEGGGSMHGCWSGNGSSSSRSTLDRASSRVTWVVMVAACGVSLWAGCGADGECSSDSRGSFHGGIQDGEPAHRTPSNLHPYMYSQYESLSGRAFVMMFYLGVTPGCSLELLLAVLRETLWVIRRAGCMQGNHLAPVVEHLSDLCDAQKNKNRTKQG